jgi:predicted helicase
MERQRVETDKESGIINDTHDRAEGTMQKPRYPLDLLLRVISVSFETMKIVRSITRLSI